MGFKNGMLGKFVWNKKGKCKKTKDKETKNINGFPKGVDGQKSKEKMEFWKGRQKENQKKTTE